MKCKIVFLFLTLVLIFFAGQSSGRDDPPGAISSSTASPADPRLLLVGSTYWAYAHDIAMAGDYACCAMNYGLLIIDASNPAAPKEASRLHIRFEQYRSLAADSDRVYIGDDNIIYITDITDPAGPVMAGAIELPYLSIPTGMALSDTLIYFMVSGDGLYVYSVTNPESPYQTGHLSLGGSAIVLDGNYAYIASYWDGLQIVDISDPTQPELIGNCDDFRYVNQVGLSGDYAYLSMGSSGLYVVDVTDKTNPTLETNFDPGARLDHMTVDGNYIYATSMYDGLQIINVGDPLNPFVEGSSNLAKGAPALGNGYLFVTNEEIDLSVFDVSLPSSPIRIGHHYFYDYTGDIAFSGDYLLAVGKDLKIFKGTEFVHGDNDAGGWAIEIDDTLAYIISSDSLFKIVSVADPLNTFMVSQIQLGAWPNDVAFYGDYVYVATRNAEIVIIDVSDAANPFIAGNAPAGYVDRLIVAGDYLYYHNGLCDGLSIYSLNNPLAPELEGQVPVYNNVTDLTAAGDYIYVATAVYELMFGYLTVVDVSNKQNPEIITTYRTDMESFAVAIRGNYAYVGSYGLEHLNIADPGNIYRVELIDDINPRRILVRDDKAYVADWRRLYEFDTDVLCADANDDGSINVGDAVLIICWIFKGGYPPYTGDVNCDGTINMGDVVYLVNYIFRSGAEPCAACK